MPEGIAEHRHATDRVVLRASVQHRFPGDGRATRPSTSSTVRCRVTAAPRSRIGASTWISGCGSDIIQRAPSMLSSQCPIRPSGMTIGW